MMRSKPSPSRWMKLSSLLLSAILLCPALASTISTQLRTEEAWVGEGVSLLITLRSTGPFSGSTSFDLPEQAGLFFVDQGSPTVSTRSEDGVEWLTLQHEFKIYSQREGTIQIPPIGVRYHAKQGFLTEAELHEESTEPMQFVAKRPEGLGGIVVAAESMTLSQQWSGLQHERFELGDVITRTIVREAEETISMLMPPPDTTAPEQLRVYTTDPTLTDQTQRGQASATRTDVIKYQLIADGEFSLPALEFTWWDLSSDQIATHTLSGAVITVEAVTPPSQPTPSRNMIEPLLQSIGALLISAFIGYGIWKFLRHPARVARRNLWRACARNDANAAYAATRQWLQVIFPESEIPEKNLTDLQKQQWCKLKSKIYASSETHWIGTDYRKTMRHLAPCRRKLSAKKVDKRLSALNPF